MHWFSLKAFILVVNCGGIFLPFDCLFFEKIINYSPAQMPLRENTYQRATCAKNILIEASKTLNTKKLFGVNQQNNRSFESE